MPDADDDLIVIVHEQVEKALARVYRRTSLVLFAATAALVTGYSAARDYLEVYLPGSAILASVANAVSCRTPLFFMIQDVCHLSELQPGNERTLILLVGVAVLGIVGVLALAYSTVLSLHLIRQVYGYYIVGDIQYTRKRFLWLLVGIGSALLNAVAQGFGAYARSYDPEGAARVFAPTTRFWLTLTSICWLYWALLQIIQFAVFAGLVAVKRRQGRVRD